MRKYFLSFVALAAGLFATSCQESIVEPQIAGPTTFTVQLPNQMGTKAIGDAENVDKLYVAVYDEADLGATAIFKTKEDVVNGVAKVTLNLIQDQKYDIVFWAQKGESYVDENSELLSIPMKNTFHNSEEGAAFFHFEDEFTPGDPSDITLRRPFAQLNLGTTPESLKTDVQSDSLKLSKSYIKVEKVATTFNTVLGVGEGEQTIEFALANVPSQKLYVGGVKYYYVSMDYLPIAGDDQALVNVNAKITLDNDQVIDHTFTSVPVRENYRTNIVGNLISSTTDFKVEIDDRFEEDYSNTDDIISNDYFVVDNVSAAEDAFEDGETHVAINYIVNSGEINIPTTAKETLYLQLPDVDAVFTVIVPQEVKKLNITVPNTDESNVGLDLIVVAPNSTVEIKDSQLNTINGTTAQNTLILNGVTVNEVVVEQGNVVIENESKVSVLDNQSGGKVTVYVDSTSDVNVPENDNFEKIEEPEIIDTYEALQNALTYSSDVVLTNDITLSEILVIQRRDFIFDGNGYTLKSTAGRAINVSGADGVTIKNLTIECSGERAINIIQGATNVTIDNVTATAANYTVNVAGSAPNAFVDIKNTTLNGLCTVNVAGAGAEVYVNNSTVNCNDNNTTEGEAYAALSLNKDAVKGKIIASETEVNVTEGSDSKKGRNGAEDGEVLINGSTEGVVVMVAAITYPGSDYYYSFASLNEAFEFAQKENRPVTLIRSITVEEPIVIEEGQTFVLDLNGKTLTASEKCPDGYAITNKGELTIKNNGVINGVVYAEGTAAETIIDGGTYNALENAKYVLLNSQGASLTINAATINGGSSYPIYSYDDNSKLVINDATVNATFGCVNSYGTNGSVEINGGTFKMTGVQGNTSHIAYFSRNCTVNINGGTFEKIGNISMSGTGGGGICVNGGAMLTINGGSFAGDYDDVYNYGGSIIVKGGTYKFEPDFLADGYKAVKNADGKWEVVAKTYVAQIGDDKYESLNEAVAAVQNDQTITFLSDVEQADGVILTDKNITVDLNGKTFTVSEGASTNNRNFKINGSSIVTIKNGIMIAAGELTSGAYGTVRAEGDAVVNLEAVKLYSYRGHGLNVKANTGTKVNIKDSEIYSQYSGGVEAAGGRIELTNVKIDQKGVYSGAAWCSVAIGVNGGGEVVVNSGEYNAATITTDANAAQGTWVAYVMSSGGTLEINGGTFNATVAETANAANACGVICADRAAVVNINGGIFNSNGAILDMRNNVGTLPNPVATLQGGNFSANPTVSGLYSSNLIKVADGYVVTEPDADGRYSVVKEEVPQN